MDDFILYGVALPSLAAGVLLLIMWRPWRPSLIPAESTEPAPPSVGADGAGGIAFAVAYLTSHLAVHGRPAGAVWEAWEWLLLLAPLAALLGLIDRWATRRSWATWATPIALALTTGWLLVPSFQTSEWIWRLGIGGAVFGLSISQRVHSQRFPGYVLPCAWLLIGASGLPVLVASANAKFGIFSCAIAATAGCSVAVWLWPRGSGRFRSAVPVVAVLFPSIFLSGYFNDYGDVPLASFLLLVVAPLALWLGTLVLRGPAPKGLGVVTGLLAVGGSCAVALALAWPALTAHVGP